MNNEQARQFVSALFKEVFETYDRTKIDKFFSKELTGFLLQSPIGFDDITQWVDRLEESYPTLQFMVHQIVAEQNAIAAVVNLTLSTTAKKDLYVSIAIFMELDTKGQITKWRSFSNS